MTKAKQNEASKTHYTPEEILSMEVETMPTNPHAAAALAWARVVAENFEQICDDLCNGMFNFQSFQYLEDALEQLSTAADWLPECNDSGDKKSKGRGSYAEI